MPMKVAQDGEMVDISRYRRFFYRRKQPKNKIDVVGSHIYACVVEKPHSMSSTSQIDIIFMC